MRDAVTAFNRGRPITMNIMNVQCITDPFFKQGYVLPKYSTNVGGTQPFGGWGGNGATAGGLHRNTLRGSGILPKFLIGCPLVTLTWSTAANSGQGGTLVIQANHVGPWKNTAPGTAVTTPTGLPLTTWTRTFLVPGLIYVRRVWLGGQGKSSLLPSTFLFCIFEIKVMARIFSLINMVNSY